MPEIIDVDVLRMRMRKVGLNGRKVSNILRVDAAAVSHALNGNRPALLERIHGLVERRERRNLIHGNATVAA